MHKEYNCKILLYIVSKITNFGIEILEIKIE